LADTLNQASLRPRIGIFGGSFDPVHCGHLVLMRWAIETLKLDQLLVIPAQRSWQKSAPGASPAVRLEMLQLALQTLDQGLGSRIMVDAIELNGPTPSYTVPTLRALRERYGPAASLVLLMGSDQLHNLSTWHRFQDLLGLAHIAVTQREQLALQDFPPAVEALVRQFGLEVLPDAAQGSIVFFRMPLMPVSSTRLRADLAAGHDVGALLPPTVAAYIAQHQLYTKGV
jgi:nicotinate-nucleotide adenylyltransferase